jgi:hypothetical protein
MLLVVSATGVVVLAFVSLHGLRGAGRIYHGKSVSSWVDLCVESENNTFTGEGEPGFKEICEIGPEAVPYLIEAIKRKPDFTATRFYKAAYAKIPALIADKIPTPKEPYTRPFRAYTIIGELGPAARSAVPFLASAFNATAG